MTIFKKVFLYTSVVCVLFTASKILGSTKTITTAIINDVIDDLTSDSYSIHTTTLGTDYISFPISNPYDTPSSPQTVIAEWITESGLSSRYGASDNASSWQTGATFTGNADQAAYYTALQAILNVALAYGQEGYNESGWISGLLNTQTTLLTSNNNVPVKKVFHDLINLTSTDTDTIIKNIASLTSSSGELLGSIQDQINPLSGVIQSGSVITMMPGSGISSGTTMLLMPGVLAYEIILGRLNASGNNFFQITPESPTPSAYITNVYDDLSNFLSTMETVTPQTTEDALTTYNQTLDSFVINYANTVLGYAAKSTATANNIRIYAANYANGHSLAQQIGVHKLIGHAAFPNLNDDAVLVIGEARNGLQVDSSALVAFGFINDFGYENVTAQQLLNIVACLAPSATSIEPGHSTPTNYSYSFPFSWIAPTVDGATVSVPAQWQTALGFSASTLIDVFSELALLNNPSSIDSTAISAVFEKSERGYFQNLLKQYYNGVFCREATTREVIGWAFATDTLPLSNASMISYMLGTTEGQNVQFVLALYQTVLGREPDKSGFIGNVAAINAAIKGGQSQEAAQQALASGFLAGPEFSGKSIQVSSVGGLPAWAATSAQGVSGITFTQPTISVGSAGEGIAAFINSSEFQTNSAAAIKQWIRNYATSTVFPGVSYTTFMDSESSESTSENPTDTEVSIA